MAIPAGSSGAASLSVPGHTLSVPCRGAVNAPSAPPLRLAGTHVAEAVRGLHVLLALRQQGRPMTLGQASIAIADGAAAGAGSAAPFKTRLHSGGVWVGDIAGRLQIGVARSA